MSGAMIAVEGLGKKYRIRHQAERQRYVALRDVFADKFRNLFGTRNSELGTRNSVEDFWALRDVSFEVKQGEVVGIIGRNGAGKSTLLKILSRITEPSEGRVTLRGRVASLLEVGTGFHPELTGRENIFLNGAILGMSRAEVRRKFDEIVAFAEVEKFLDTPVKRYSSGMYVRLAFAVAAHLEPEILIVDEVLAVGDAEFQKKCLGKMQEVSRGEGRTVLFVSHNIGVVSAITERAIWLQKGRVTASGSSVQITEAYLKQAAAVAEMPQKPIESYRRSHRHADVVNIKRIEARGHKSPETPSIPMGGCVEIQIEIEVLKELQGAEVNLILKTSRSERAAVLYSGDFGRQLFLKPGCHCIVIRITDFTLSPGQYFADIGINRSRESLAYDVILDYPLLSIVNTGQVTHWLDRPWGISHFHTVHWHIDS